MVEEEGSRAKAEAPGPHPPRFRLMAGAALTWRGYCARPGALSCGTFDSRPAEQQLGDSTDFISKAPYGGLAVEAELFPLARRDSLARGLGLTLALQHGFVPTAVTITSPTGSTPTREVSATDTAYGAMLAWRLFFNPNIAGSPLGHAGLRLGVLGREFAVDETLSAALPVVHRLFPAAGLELSVPLLRQLRVEGGVRFFFQPSAGQWRLRGEKGPYASEVRDYGTQVSSSGWDAQVGVGGELWGPFGYSVRGRLEGYTDRFSGEGARRGWSAGGVAEDTYLSVVGGVTALWW